MDLTDYESVPFRDLDDFQTKLRNVVMEDTACLCAGYQIEEDALETLAQAMADDQQCPVKICRVRNMAPHVALLFWPHSGNGCVIPLGGTEHLN